MRFLAAIRNSDQFQYRDHQGHAVAIHVDAIHVDVHHDDPANTINNVSCAVAYRRDDARGMTGLR
jgi:hypothetical protein